MLVRFGLGLACRLMVALAVVGRTSNVFDLRRVAEILAAHFMMEEMFDHCSSKILHVAWIVIEKIGLV